MKKITKLLLTLILTFTSILSINASTAKVTVSTNKSTLTVGNTVTATVKISSSVTLGAWEFTIDYDKSKLKLVSGDVNVVGYGDNKIKSKSYTYSFKAIAKGSTTISVKAVGAMDWEEKSFSITKSSKTIKIITQAELESSYSKDNYLKSLSIDDLSISPTFTKDNTTYKVDAPSDTTKINIKATANDSKASISGNGEHEVSEGENKFTITVTAENGSTKEYNIIVNVVDPNPINININNKEYLIVKRTSLLEIPEGYEEKELEIQEQKIKVFYNETNKITLIGLKDTEGNIELFIYNEDDKTYTKYNEIKLDQLLILPLDIDKKFDSLYKESTIKINDTEIKCLKQDNSEFAIIKAQNLSNGEKDYYLYDSKTNTLIRYTDEMTKEYKEKIKMYTEIICLLGAETTIIIFILMCILISKMRKNKKRKKRIQEEKRKLEEQKKLEEEKLLEEQKRLEEEKNKKATRKTKSKKKVEVTKKDE